MFSKILAGVILLISAPFAAANWCDSEKIVPEVDGNCPGINRSLQAVPDTVEPDCVTFLYNSTSVSGTSYIAVYDGADVVIPGCPVVDSIEDRRLCTVRVRDEWIKNGFGAVASSSQAAITGERSQRVCGLPPSTAHTAALLDINDTMLDGLHGEPLSVTFTTSPSITPPGTVDAPEWFLDPQNGSDGYPGNSRSLPFKTMPAAMAAMSTGDDIAILPGSIFEDTAWRITKGGTSENRTYIGTNYLSGGQDYWYNEGPEAFSAVRSEVNGTYEFGACAGDGDGTDCQYALSGSNLAAVPVNQFRGCVEIQASTAPYVVLRGMEVRDCAGNAIQVLEAFTSPSKFIAEDIKIHSSMKRAVQVSNAVEGGNAIFRRIDMDEVSLQKPDNLGGVHSGCVSFDSNNSDIDSGILMENSTLDNCGGEGYSTLRIGRVHFRDSTAANVYNAILYPDASKNVLYERMRVVAKRYGGFEGTASPIAFGVECYGPNTQSATGNVFRDIIVTEVSSTQTAIRLFIEANNGCPEPFKSQGYDPRAEGFQVGGTVIGSTILGRPGYQITSCTGCTTNNNLAEFVVKNNIFEGSITGSVPTAAGVDWDYNSFDGTPADADMLGANDNYLGSGLANDTTWSSENFPTYAEVNLLLGSAAVDAGVYLNSQLLSAANYANFTNVTGGCLLSQSAWEAGSLADANCVTRPNPPNMGASEATEAPITGLSTAGRYFLKDGSPIFPVGITTWLTPTAISTTASKADVDTFLETVAADGFTIVQGPISIDRADGLVFPQAGPDDLTKLMQIDGAYPFTAFNSSSFTLNSTYWAHHDYWISKASTEGLFTVMTPVWGPMIDEIFSSYTNYKNFFTAIVQRYAANNKVIWNIAGEYQKLAWQTVARDDETLSTAELQLLQDVLQIAANEAHPDSIMGFHPDGYKSTSEHWDSDSRVDYHMLQAYDSINQAITDLATDLALPTIRPVWQSEVAYEESAEGTPWQVRMGAYHSFVGGAGAYTYGHNNMWPRNGDPLGELTSEGYLDIVNHFIPFVNTYHGTGVTPKHSLIVSGQGSSVDGTDTYISAAVLSGSTGIIVYTSKGNTFSLDTITDLGSGSLNAEWFNPRTGVTTSLGTITSGESVSFNPPGSPAVDNDYVLIVTKP